jgi:hypothetical protein
VDVTVDGGTEVDVGRDEIDGEVATGIGVGVGVGTGGVGVGGVGVGGVGVGGVGVGGVGVGGVGINTAPTVRTCSAWAAAP